MKFGLHGIETNFSSSIENMKYRVKQKRNGINNKQLYYAESVWSGLVGTREIAEQIARRSSLTPGDVRAALYALAEVMESYLHAGYSVKLDELGVFRLSATSEGYEQPDDCTPHRVRAARLCFRADPHLKKGLKHVKFERDKKRD
jgi:predicted histone-like DNA-binding protein